VQEMEGLTYPLQKQYLKQVHDFDWEYDPLWHHMVSNCPGRI